MHVLLNTAYEGLPVLDDIDYACILCDEHGFLGVLVVCLDIIVGLLETFVSICIGNAVLKGQGKRLLIHSGKGIGIGQATVYQGYLDRVHFRRRIRERDNHKRRVRQGQRVQRLDRVHSPQGLAKEGIASEPGSGIVHVEV